MGNSATKEAQAGTIHHAGGETHHAQYITSPPVSPARVASLQEDVLDPRSPGALKRTPVHSPQFGSRPSSTYKDRVLNRFMQQSSPMDPRSPAALRTPLSKIGIAVVRTPPPINLSVGDPRSPFMMRTPLHLTQETVFVDDDVVVCDGAEVAEEVVSKQDQADEASTAQKEYKTSSMGMSPSPAIMALSASSPLDSPSLNRKRKASSRRQTMSPLKKSFSAPMPDENTPQNTMKSSTATTPTLTPTPASATALSSKPRTPLSPLTNTRAVNSHNCGPIQPIKFRMDPGILG